MLILQSILCIAFVAKTVTCNCNVSETLKDPQEDIEILGTLSSIEGNKLQPEFKLFNNIPSRCVQAAIRYKNPIMLLKFFCNHTASGAGLEKKIIVWNATYVRVNINNNAEEGVFQLDACSTVDNTSASIIIRHNTLTLVEPDRLVKSYGVKCVCNFNLYLDVYFSSEMSLSSINDRFANTSRHLVILGVLVIVMAVLILYVGYLKLKTF